MPACSRGQPAGSGSAWQVQGASSCVHVLSVHPGSCRGPAAGRPGCPIRQAQGARRVQHAAGAVPCRTCGCSCLRVSTRWPARSRRCRRRSPPWTARPCASAASARTPPPPGRHPCAAVEPAVVQGTSQLVCPSAAADRAGGWRSWGWVLAHAWPCTVTCALLSGAHHDVASWQVLHDQVQEHLVLHRKAWGGSGGQQGTVSQQRRERASIPGEAQQRPARAWKE